VPGLLLLPRFSSLHAMSHLPPAHQETSKHDSLNETKVKEKIKQNYPGFEFKSHQVNDSSQSNQIIDHLVSHQSIEFKEPRAATWSFDHLTIYRSLTTYL
jgi:hypothetical protein